MIIPKFTGEPPPSIKHIENICSGGEKTGEPKKVCSFLGILNGQYFCMKSNDRTRLEVEEARQMKMIVQMGNCCSGPPEFKERNIQQ